ncbi:basic salivary proline-rich protein 2-like [Penaeus chinensis]|uniref:basic salivary proline-rich protein 2-like n=1 Tax=Penaeus chinensis TaxID=139456 RepID=UPI001FB5E64C|nr:basic salivary proline-rich protein 2-like [Penaeus chinensis]
MALTVKESGMCLLALLLVNGGAAQRTGGLLKPSGDRPIGVTPPSGNGNRVDNTRPLLQPFNGNVYNSHSSSSKRPPPGADLGPSQGSFASSFQEYPQGSFQGPPSPQGQGHSFQFQSTGISGSGGVTKTPSGVEVGGSRDKSPPVAGFTNAAQGASSGGRPSSGGASSGGLPPPDGPPSDSALASSSAAAGNPPKNGNKGEANLSLGGFGGAFGLGGKDKVSAAAQEASDPSQDGDKKPSNPSSRGKNTGNKQTSPWPTLVLLLPVALHAIPR